MRRRASRVLADGTDRGAASVFVIGLVVALMVVAGLVVDGGRAVNARAAAMDVAEQAARAGAGAVDLATLRTTGAVRLDAGAARAAAVGFAAGEGYAAGTTSVDVVDRTVRVTVRADVPTTLLQLVLVRSFSVEGSAVARAAVGIDSEIPGGP